MTFWKWSKTAARQQRPGLRTSKAPMAGAKWLPIAHAADRPFCGPIKVRPDVGAAPAARPANEPRLEVGQPQIVRPAIGVQGHAVAASVVSAVD